MLSQDGGFRWGCRAGPLAAGCAVARRIAPLLAGLVLVVGCEALPPSGPEAAAERPVAAAAPAPADPLLAFAASAGPGAESVVAGRRVRVARAYAAASGKECRELLIGSGIGERSAVVCNDPVAGWAHARPLLRGSGIGLP